MSRKQDDIYLYFKIFRYLENFFISLMLTYLSNFEMGRKEPGLYIFRMGRSSVALDNRVTILQSTEKAQGN